MAPKASNSNNPMNRLLRLAGWALIVGTLASCANVARQSPDTASGAPAQANTRSTPLGGTTAANTDDDVPLPPPLLQGKSRWVAVRWAELPGLADDSIFEAWNAWLKSCERPGPVFVRLCADVRRLSIATAAEQRQWLQSRLQPYRVESLQSEAQGLLTAYYEPILQASRLPTTSFNVPLYQPPAGLVARKPWFTRQEIDTLPQAQAALKGREIAYLSDPVDALVLQIQGSGRVQITQPDGSKAWIRLAYAGTNDQPYKSVGRWLLDQGAIKDASWPGIKAWTVQNPKRVQEMIWSNPRMVFFKEESLLGADADLGPKGAQGVALTPLRSIAVDPQSIPYGTPVWLSSAGPQVNLQRLVMAQDTGSAIVGAVRADYFVGWGPEAGDLAGRLKQPLKLWVLWPK